MAKQISPKTVDCLRHEDKRRNIPTAEYQSLVEKGTEAEKKLRYPRNTDLDPQLVWRGKIDLFSDFNGIPEGATRTEFYQHDQNWANRMILGDLLQVMASLAEREGMTVTSAYENACAITGDHTLPVLEAAHIKPFSSSGPHLVTNGMLLRSDLHKFFDSGYLTITPDYHVEISPRIREEYHNGKEYYLMHGRKLIVTPRTAGDRPNIELLRWHNENIFQAS